MTKLLCALSLAAAIAAPLEAQKRVAATSAWIKAPAAGETTALAFVDVENPTMYDVYVVSAETDAAGKVELRRRVKDSAKDEAVMEITAPAYGSVAMTPDGVYLLLSDLKKPLKAGDKVTLTLVIDSGISMTIDADVKQSQP